MVSDAIADDVKSVHAGVVNLRGELSDPCLTYVK